MAIVTKTSLPAKKPATQKKPAANLPAVPARRRRRKPRSLSGINTNKIMQAAINNAAASAAGLGARMVVNTVGKENKTNLFLGHIISFLGGSALETMAKTAILQKVAAGAAIGSGLALGANIGSKLGVTTLSGVQMDENPVTLDEVSQYSLGQLNKMELGQLNEMQLSGDFDDMDELSGDFDDMEELSGDYDEDYDY
jgi:hypothetical protein